MNAGLTDADWSPLVTDSDLAVSFADPVRDDSPLTFVNAAFCRLTGYERAVCEGRNCRFLQGEATQAEAVARVRQGIAERRFRLTELINYRRNGEAFRNALLIGPILDERGELVRLFGMQWDLGLTLWRRSDTRSDDTRSEGWSLPNLRLDLFESLIDRLARQSTEMASAARGIAVVERLIAVSRPQQYPPEKRLPNWTQAHALLEYLIDPYRFTLPCAVQLSGDVGIVASAVATPLALVVHELAMHTVRLSNAGVGIVSIQMQCEAASEQGEPTLRLRWLTQCRAAAALEAPDDDFAIVHAVTGHVGSHFDYRLDGGRLEATMSVPNRPWQAAALASGPAPVPSADLQDET